MPFLFMKAERITVFCSSSDKVATVYAEAARALGRLLVSEKITLIYGGGGIGLMRNLADSVLEGGGRVIGIIPRFMLEVEWGHPSLTERVVVETMHQRKESFLKDTDAVVALPGGCGTVEELMEAITLKRLGIFHKPIIIINTLGFFDPLVEQLEKMIDERFMRPEHRGIWSVISSPTELMDALDKSVPWDSSARNFAAV
jgi:uncharacterized protein (TIGR00730 family)